MPSMSNGMISTSSINARGSNMPNCKVLSKASPEILNWMIHAKFVRKEFDQCKVLAAEELKRSNGYSEYANYILGKIFQEDGEIQNALKYFKKCNSLNPQNIENLKQAGRCLFLLGRYELALEAFFKAEKLSEIPDWNIYHHLGICYVKLKNEEKAKEYLKRAVQLGRNEKSFLELANLYESSLDYVNAIDVYTTALRLFPASTELSVNLGLVYMKIEDYKRAFNQLGCAIAHDPSNPDALFTFAAEIQRHGEYDVAVLKYKIAAQKLPECAEMWNNIGMCFFGKRKYVAAITCLKRAYYLNPTNWLTTYNLGLLHLNTRQHASAAIFLSATAKLNSQHGPTFTLLALMNPNEYDVNYSGSQRGRTSNYGRNHDYDRGSLSTRNDYDVDSMLSSRSLIRDPRWDRRSAADNYDRRSDVSAPPTQYSRANSPPRPHAYASYRGSEYDKPDPPMRREHSPIMKAPRTATFKGFTSALPGNDHGYDDIGSRRTHYVPPPEPERSYKGFTSSSLHEPSYKDQRFRYSGSRDQYPEDYPPEAGSNMRVPPRRYVPDSDSVSTRNHEFDGCDRSWDNSYSGEQSLSPKTFKKECQRAYKEARDQRMRNLEEGLYGKCDWATFDISLKHLGDVSNCKRCFEEALKRNKDDVETCVNYALFLFSLNEKTQAAKYHSHFLHLLNIVPNIDKELIHMGNSLTEALKNDQIENTEDDSVFTDTVSSTKILQGDGNPIPSNATENDFEDDLV